MKTESFTVNGYKIQFNQYWNEYQVSHPLIGANIARFNEKNDAIEYALNG